MTTETKRYVIEGFENLTPQEVFDMGARQHSLSTKVLEDAGLLSKPKEQE